eukprot:gnl/TRDRNA2_/TRDRNA2_127584_c0_seq1.p1 gnl/TRDRNA2_/TRDRNA2_127584_c0~~gnl/TRDRNA2_/TRDRNA2_127584_c0_seq1.p1  ORF type:complete len:282 (-),score=45.78 gnl/TRDRNA2_/TRDRNA2_127584_c0_seq1:154-999(-)
MVPGHSPTRLVTGYAWGEGRMPAAAAAAAPSPAQMQAKLSRVVSAKELTSPQPAPPLTRTMSSLTPWQPSTQYLQRSPIALPPSSFQEQVAPQAAAPAPPQRSTSFRQLQATAAQSQQHQQQPATARLSSVSTAGVSVSSRSRVHSPSRSSPEALMRGRVSVARGSGEKLGPATQSFGATSSPSLSALPAAAGMPAAPVLANRGATPRPSTSFVPGPPGTTSRPTSSFVPAAPRAMTARGSPRGGWGLGLMPSSSSFRVSSTTDLQAILSRPQVAIAVATR